MPRRIKRYANRKLYDTEANSYVSLSDIAGLVRQGETVKVIDNETGDDLTEQTLTQIILEEGRRGNSLISTEVLHDLLREGHRTVDTGLAQLREGAQGLLERSLGQLNHLVRGSTDQEVEQLRAQIAHLETLIEELLEETKSAKEETS